VLSSMPGAPHLDFEMRVCSDHFEKSLETMRLRSDFWITGYAVMPEHLHLLVGETRGCVAEQGDSGIETIGRRAAAGAAVLAGPVLRLQRLFGVRSASYSAHEEVAGLIVGVCLTVPEENAPRKARISSLSRSRPVGT
jgi:hypothetical protein